MRHLHAVQSAMGPTKQQSAIRGEVGDVLRNGGIAVLIGPSGVGKTFFAVGMGYTAIRDGLRVRYTRLKDMLDDHRDRVFGQGRSVESWRQQYAWPALLIIDDTHERRETTEEDLLIGDIIDKRYAACVRPTIMISNHRRGPFEESVGPSIASRIQEGGRIFDEPAGWRDIRKDGLP